MSLHYFVFIVLILARSEAILNFVKKLNCGAEVQMCKYTDRTMILLQGHICLLNICD